jgi:hypothetical protein
MYYTCDGGKTKTTYLLIKYPPQVQEQINSLNKDNPNEDLRRSQLIAEGYWVRGPAKNSQWVPVASPQGQALTAIPPCPNGKAGEIAVP